MIASQLSGDRPCDPARHSRAAPPIGLRRSAQGANRPILVPILSCFLIILAQSRTVMGLTVRWHLGCGMYNAARQEEMSTAPYCGSLRWPICRMPSWRGGDAHRYPPDRHRGCVALPRFALANSWWPRSRPRPSSPSASSRPSSWPSPSRSRTHHQPPTVHRLLTTKPTGDMASNRSNRGPRRCPDPRVSLRGSLYYANGALRDRDSPILRTLVRCDSRHQPSPTSTTAVPKPSPPSWTRPGWA